MVCTSYCIPLASEPCGRKVSRVMLKEAVGEAGEVGCVWGWVGGDGMDRDPRFVRWG